MGCGRQLRSQCLEREPILAQEGSGSPTLPPHPRVPKPGISDRMEGKAAQAETAEGSSAEAVDKDTAGLIRGQNPPQGCGEGAGAEPMSLPISHCLKGAGTRPLFPTALNSSPQTRGSRENSGTTQGEQPLSGAHQTQPLVHIWQQLDGDGLEPRAGAVTHSHRRVRGQHWAVLGIFHHGLPNILRTSLHGSCSTGPTHPCSPRSP